jgi:hypothetical protein
MWNGAREWLIVAAEGHFVAVEVYILRAVDGVDIEI